MSILQFGLIEHVTYLLNKVSYICIFSILGFVDFPYILAILEDRDSLKTKICKKQIFQR